jgi:RNA binding exosome subunit
MSDIQEQIKIAHRKALEQDFNEILKELKQEEHKNLELSMRINKQKEVLDKIKEYINDDTVFDGSAMCKNDLDKILEEIE